MLSQALKTGDSGMLETCLQYSNANMVNNTVRALPSALVAPFIQELVQRIHINPARTLKLSIWLRSIILYHVSYIASVPLLQKQLHELLMVITRRAKNAENIAILHGRIDMLLSQAEMRQPVQNVVEKQISLKNLKSATTYVSGMDSDFSSSGDEKEVAELVEEVESEDNVEISSDDTDDDKNSDDSDGNSDEDSEEDEASSEDERQDDASSISSTLESLPSDNDEESDDDMTSE